jgi:hypothetical protein
MAGACKETVPEKSEVSFYQERRNNLLKCLE